jgi:hypothetical protein
MYFSTRKNKLTLLQEMKKYINERLAKRKQEEPLQSTKFLEEVANQLEQVKVNAEPRTD